MPRRKPAQQCGPAVSRGPPRTRRVRCPLRTSRAAPRRGPPPSRRTQAGGPGCRPHAACGGRTAVAPGSPSPASRAPPHAGRAQRRGTRRNPGRRPPPGTGPGPPSPSRRYALSRPEENVPPSSGTSRAAPHTPREDAPERTCRSGLLEEVRAPPPEHRFPLLLNEGGETMRMLQPVLTAGRRTAGDIRRSPRGRRSARPRCSPATATPAPESKRRKHGCVGHGRNPPGGPARWPLPTDLAPGPASCGQPAKGPMPSTGPRDRTTRGPTPGPSAVKRGRRQCPDAH
ncbi:hypothetical protein K378_05924 [Streptomyces sp. Amel2xB2]|nr:hypothetical protein K378_05924 [Streptomyces sp. Amel2xB2]